MWLNTKIPELFLRGIRSCTSDVEDEKKGIKISKKDWEKLHLHIASCSNFPSAAGLASSAAGFACPVFALAKLMNVKEDQEKLSAIVRFRKCLSQFIWGIFQVDNEGRMGMDNIAVQLAGPNAVLIARSRKVAAHLLQRLLFHFPPPSDTDLNSIRISFQPTNLRDMVILSVQDLGEGLVPLSDESRALLNVETGLPK